MKVGIDLGTTNSLIGTFAAGKAQLIPNAFGKFITPSIISFDKNNIFVGDAARERLFTHPGTTVSEFKRSLGSDKTYHFLDKTFRPEELSALILRQLIEDAKAFCQEDIEAAIITVPAYFNALQRKATQQAAEMIGLKVECFINEPTAAALAYGLIHEHDQSQVMVVDLGGGTLDVSIMEQFEGIMEIRASAGNNFLGGKDFTDAIINDMVESLNLPISVDEYTTFFKQAEMVKRQLSNKQSVEIALHCQQQAFTYHLSRDKFEHITEHLIHKIQQPIMQALRDSQLDPEKIDHIVLVGGATRMPFFKQLIAKLFKKFPLHGFNPDEIVALGACNMIGLRENNSVFSERVLTDVCPYTLGTKALANNSNQEIYVPIIERNTTLPCSKSQYFSLVQDNQKELIVTVYQGESMDPINNIKIGKFTLKLPPGLKLGEVLEIRFSYDINGLLEIEVSMLQHANVSCTEIIEHNASTLSDEEKQASIKKLAKLKTNPIEDEIVKTLLARADRIYIDLQGDHKMQLAETVSHFKAKLHNISAIDLKKLCEQLVQYLDEFDGLLV